MLEIHPRVFEWTVSGTYYVLGAEDVGVLALLCWSKADNAWCDYYGRIMGVRLEDAKRECERVHGNEP